MDYIKQIENLVQQHTSNQLPRYITGEAKAWLISQTQKYNPKNIMESVYIILHGAPPVCECGNKKKFNTFVLGYRQCCTLGNKCNYTNRMRHEKQKQTMLEKHGSMCTNEMKEKRKKTMLEKYGVEYGAQSKQAREKLSLARKNLTKEEKEQIVRKTKETTRKKYGVDHHMQLDEQKKKVQQTNLSKYGVTAPLQYVEFKEKQKQTLANKSQTQKIETLKKQKLTFLEKYGVDAASRIPVPHVTLEILQDSEKFIEFVTNKTREQVLTELKIAPHTLYLYAKNMAPHRILRNQ